MRTCSSCNTSLPDDAAFCTSCGAMQEEGPIRATAVPQAPPIAPAYTAISALSTSKKFCLVGGILALIGTLLPSFYIGGDPQTDQFMMTYGGVGSILHFGIPGFLILILPVVLGLAPFTLRPSLTLALAGMGVCTIALTELTTGWILMTIMGYFATAAAMAGGGVVAGQGNIPSFAIAFGFYCMLIGFALLFYGYARSASFARS